MNLNGLTEISKRTRYNFWNLLGDVGGFNDGLFLVCEIFMATYAALSFKIDYLNNLAVEKTKSDKSKDSTKQYEVLKKMQIDEKLDEETISIF